MQVTRQPILADLKPWREYRMGALTAELPQKFKLMHDVAFLIDSVVFGTYCQRVR